MTNFSPRYQNFLQFLTLITKILTNLTNFANFHKNVDNSLTWNTKKNRILFRNTKTWDNFWPLRPKLWQIFALKNRGYLLLRYRRVWVRKPCCWWPPAVRPRRFWSSLRNRNKDPEPASASAAGIRTAERSPTAAGNADDRARRRTGIDSWNQINGQRSRWIHSNHSNVFNHCFRADIQQCWLELNWKKKHSHNFFTWENQKIKISTHFDSFCQFQQELW